MAISTEPNITRLILEYIIPTSVINYHRLQQLITDSISLYKQQNSYLEAGKF